MAEPKSWRSRQRQPDGISARAVLGVGFGTALFLGLAMAGLWGFYRFAEDGRAPDAVHAFPPPVLQSDAAGDLQRYVAAQRAELESYAWVDRERGIARIPIERAMEIIAARGEAAFAPLVPEQPVTAVRR